MVSCGSRRVTRYISSGSGFTFMFSFFFFVLFFSFFLRVSGCYLKTHTLREHEFVLQSNAKNGNVNIKFTTLIGKETLGLFT